MSNVALYDTQVPSPFPLARGASLTTRVPSERDRHPHPVRKAQATASTPSHGLMRILIVSPDVDACAALREVFEREGREVLHAPSPTGLVEMIGRADVNLVISDQRLPDRSGYALLEAVRDKHPAVMTALMTAPGMSSVPVLAHEHGAPDFLTQPIVAADVVAFLRRAESAHALLGRGAALTTAGYEAPAFCGMYGTTAIMRDVFRLIARVGRTGITVLVSGESGTGKELVARALHDESARRHKPFIALNCSALPSELVESELFGHTRGAFTGAVKDRGGLFEAADGGTLFLDEIGDLGPLAQAKVLRALESGEVLRVGGTKSSHVDVRVVAATNRSLDAMVLDGRFREDLLYRLKVISLSLPPLRDRRPDIPLLASHFLHVTAERHSLPARALSDEARDVLMQYNWPGNVRELRNVIEGALVMCDGAEIAVCDLPASLTMAAPRLSLSTSLQPPLGDVPFVEARERALRDFDRAFLSAALTRHGGNIARTARALGLHRQSLQKLLARRELRNGEATREV